VKQHQNNCARRTDANGLDALYPQNGFFPPFRADLLMDREGFVKFVKVSHRNYLLYLAVLLATFLG
jgi:hypothetical protein